jgi:5'-nucleotidase
VLLLDCGDLYQGSAESLLTEGRIMTRALEALRYDAWILGNHDFDWGLDTLMGRAGETPVPVLAGNIAVQTGRRNPLSNLHPYLIREFEGVRVCIVGLTTAGVPTWSLPDQLGDLQFQHSVEALQRIMPDVRAAKPDLVVLAAHQGYKPYGDDHANEVNAVARNFPEFDAIVGGHSHQVVERAQVEDTVFTQAGYHGIWLGCLDFAYDTVTRKVADISARVLPVADQCEPDAELGALLRKDLDSAQEYLAEPVGATTDDLATSGDAAGRSPVQMLICRSIAKASGADIVLHGVLADEPLAAGEIRMADVWRIVPYENRIGLLYLTPEEIGDILLENLERRDTIHFMGAFGLAFDVAPDGAGQAEIRNLRRPDGAHLHPRKRYLVAVNSYVLASGGGRFPRLRAISLKPETRLSVTAIDTRSAVLRYVRRNRPLSADSLMHGPEM